ncbi:sarcosine oxidase subunit gamma [Sagittula sp. P11]|uniref:sarcosine oxidase subunit gamma n=1 Tax=Sagittula sp. P11 TaxID=2009329 RepID=UPI000C2D449B|nr:sarcosine oxidase subunit gamma family protein [Sagittula sp. P11]AUC54962.1 sarcosine oxidase subunit gamma [Sagittula sp. P11]
MSELAVYEGLVEVRAIGLQGMVTIRGDFASDAFREAVSGVARVAFPEQRGASVDGARGLLWMSPDELMMLVPHAEASESAAKLVEALSDQHALVLDVSDARAMFRLQGRAVREVIAKLAPLDMAPDGLQPGELRRTRFGQVAAGVWLEGEETATLFCFRSVADYMFELLSTAAHPDSRVDYFRSAAR